MMTSIPTTVLTATWLPVPLHGAILTPPCRLCLRGQSAQLAVPTLYSFRGEEVAHVSRSRLPVLVCACVRACACHTSPDSAGLSSGM